MNLPDGARREVKTVDTQGRRGAAVLGGAGGEGRAGAGLVQGDGGAVLVADAEQGGTLVDDVHSQSNATRVRRVERPSSTADVQAIVRRARAEGVGVSIAGGRHAMGGQQFGEDTVLLDLNNMRRILAFNAERGLVEVEAGIQWPELVRSLVAMRAGRERQWGIRQKQTGADRLSIGGALAANVHGRGLTMRPFIEDVEAFTLIGADGELRRCGRSEHAELFRLAIGGYGLFGVVASVTLRLAPRTKVRRVVEMIEIGDLIPAFERRIADGYLYGDFQFAIDPEGDDFLSRGVFSCYHPVPAETPMPEAWRELSREDWRELLYLAHTDKRRATDAYAAHYLATSGQVYWSDTHQFSTYVDGYHEEIDRRTGAPAKGTELITELYVPREALPSFMADAASDFRRHGVDVVYGTVRLIERDDESYLAWAQQSYACVIYNLHVDHTAEGREHAASAFRRLIDMATSYGGSYYLTYHRFASRAQVEACYPQFEEFLRLKREYDPEERFQSEWYRHYARVFSVPE